MSAISLIEFIVYGLICYSGIITLITSITKPPNKSDKDGGLAYVRAFWLVPSMICAGILAGSGVNITTITQVNTIKDLNSSEVWTENLTNNIVLQGSAWTLVHVLIFMVLLIYIIWQILALFTDPNTKGMPFGLFRK